VPAESRNKLKGCNQKDFAKRSGNKALAKGKTANSVKAQKGLNRFSDNQPHNEAAKTEQVAHGNVHSEKRKARQTKPAD
jgi:hypothetical protein